ncbi:type II toxin-antitoxin system RelE/ParE family toxin [Acidithiobacillus sp.]
MRLVWTEPAIADRIAIYDYFEVENPRTAAEMDERFMDAAERLRAYPEMGHPGRIPGTRELVAHRRYFLLYEIAGDTAYILAIVHTSRQWPPAVSTSGL